MDDGDLDRDENGRISVTLPRRLRAKLQEICAREEAPVSAVARRLLKRALETQEAA
jgi:hypothetical protein